jgi:hypothetical protein
MATDIAALRMLFYRAGCLLRDGAPIPLQATWDPAAAP